MLNSFFALTKKQLADFCLIERQSEMAQLSLSVVVSKSRHWKLPVVLNWCSSDVSLTLTAALPSGPDFLPKSICSLPGSYRGQMSLNTSCWGTNNLVGFPEASCWVPWKTGYYGKAFGLIQQHLCFMRSSTEASKSTWRIHKINLLKYRRKKHEQAFGGSKFHN